MVNLMPDSTMLFSALYIITPKKNPFLKNIEKKASKKNIILEVEKRNKQFLENTNKNFSLEKFKKLIERIEVKILFWGDIIKYIKDKNFVESEMIHDFYQLCLKYNNLIEPE